MTIGVGGRPCHLLAVIHHLHREVLVLTRIAGGDALIHGLGVDEKLEGGARLTHGRYLIVFPRIEVDVAHPGLHMAGLRLHSHKTTVHEVDHIANGVHCRHFFLDLTLVVVEDLHLMREVKIIVYGIQIAVEFLCKIFVDGLTFGNVLDEIGDFLMTFVLPRVGGAPVLVEGLLNLFHLFDGGLLGIALQACIDGGIYLQTFCI